MRLIKPKDLPIKEEYLKDLIGKYIYVPENVHVDGDETTINAWFGGKVAGYTKVFLGYDKPKKEILKTPIIGYQVILTDDIAYMLGECEIYEVSSEELIMIGKNKGEDYGYIN